MRARCHIESSTTSGPLYRGKNQEPAPFPSEQLRYVFRDPWPFRGPSGAAPIRPGRAQSGVADPILPPAGRAGALWRAVRPSIGGEHSGSYDVLLYLSRISTWVLRVSLLATCDALPVDCRSAGFGLDPQTASLGLSPIVATVILFPSEAVWHDRCLCESKTRGIRAPKATVRRHDLSPLGSHELR